MKLRGSITFFLFFGDFMAKVDCVKEVCQERFNEGKSETTKDFICKLLINWIYSFEDISKLTDLPLETIKKFNKISWFCNTWPNSLYLMKL